MEKWKRVIASILAIAVPAVVYLCYLFFMNRYSNAIVNSDMASDLVLAEHLAETNQILADDWFYSTDLRVLHTNIVFGFLFKLFSGYHTVRMVGSAILAAALFASLFFTCRKLGMDWHGACAAGSLLLLPIWGCDQLGFSYFYITLAICGYIPHIIISFVLLGFVLKSPTLKTKMGTLALDFAIIIISFISGMGGAEATVGTISPDLPRQRDQLLAI